MDLRTLLLRRRPSLLFQLFRLYVRAPEHPGKMRSERWLAWRIFPREGVPYSVKAGINLLLHPRDWIEYLLIKTGVYEPATLDFIGKNLQEGDRAFFAGINFGLHVVVAAEKVGESGKVIGIEPQPRSLFRTMENLRLNGLYHRAVLVAGALGSSPGILPMEEAPEENTGSASLRKDAQHSCLRVSVQAVEDVAKNLQCLQPKIFLIDVEGFEQLVLKGFGKTFRPLYLIIEVNREILSSCGGSELDLLREIKDLGYDLFDLKGEPAAPGTDLIESNLIAVLHGGNQPAWIG